MKELKFRKEIVEKYVEDILDTDLVGVECNDGRCIIAKTEDSFLAMTKECKSIYNKLTAENKVRYIEELKPTKVILFDNEVEMLLWYNN